MAKYIRNGKIDILKTVLAFVLAVPSALLIGWLYNFLMELNPFIILDLVIVLVAVALTAVATLGYVKWGKIRNRGIKFILILLIALLVWYCSWVFFISQNFFDAFFDFERTFTSMYLHLNYSSFVIGDNTLEISGIGMWILASIEFLLFLSPIFLVFIVTKDYFCESCQQFNVYQEYYIHAPHDQSMLDVAENSGDFRALDQFDRFDKLPEYYSSNAGIKHVYQM